MTLLPRPARLLCAWLCSLVLLAGCRAPEPVLRLHGHAMGTTWQLSVVTDASRTAELEALIQTRLTELIGQMSAWEADSDLSRFNRATPGTWHTLPPDLFYLLEHALALAEQTNGAYDPSIAPLVELWGFASDGAARSTPPAAEDIATARDQVSWQRLRLDTATGRAWQPGGIHLDINAIGPGYAVDAVAERLLSGGVSHFLFELGGEMRAAGHKPDGSAWRVAVESPLQQAERDTIVELRDQALGTSGDYRVGFMHQGRRYSHTLDPRTGAPVTHALAAVTVIHESAMAADARAAALMVLGPEQGMAFALEHELAAVFTLRHANGYQRRSTPAFERYRAR